MSDQTQKAPTPQKIVAHLDQYIIGQQEAKRQLAIAYRNKWRRSQTPAELQKEIVPTNMLIIGPTGSGKTELTKRLSHTIKAPFAKVEAPRFTERGYVGGDVNEIIRVLMDNAFSMVKKDKKKQVEEKAMRNVEEMILDILIPRTSSDQNKNLPLTAEQTSDSTSEDMNLATRERFRKKLQQGDLDDYKIDIAVQTSQNPVSAMGFVGNSVDETAVMNLENIFSKLFPKTTKRKKVTIKEASTILLEKQIEDLLDPEAMKEEALQKAQQEGIVFIDEIDKIAGSNQRNSNPNVSREGVQRDLLPLVEGTTVTTKYGPVETDHILFIAAGAFHIAQPSDLLPEFQGRFPIRVKLEPLSEKDFERILKEPKNSLIKQYQALFQAENVTLEFTDQAIHEIAHIAYQSNQTLEDIGARRLRTVLNQLLSEFLFDTPEKIKPDATITIDETIVKKRLSTILEQTDRSKYIL